MPEHEFCPKCGGTLKRIYKEGLGEVGVCQSPTCNASIVYGPKKNEKTITVHGTDHEEVQTVTTTLMQHHDKRPLLALITNWSFWFGTLLALLGVVLVAINSKGESEFVLFGQSFKSQNIAIASFFIGAVIIILNVRRILKSFDKKN